MKSQTLVTLSIIHCPPVTTAIIRRPHAREQLGFCVEDGIVRPQPQMGGDGGTGGGAKHGRLSSAAPPSPQICSLLRGGIAERGGVRVGHRIIEINGQSVVATPHARIIELLTEAHTEVRGGGRVRGGGPCSCQRRSPGTTGPPLCSPRSTSKPCRPPPTACSQARSSPCTCDRPPAPLPPPPVVP